MFEKMSDGAEIKHSEGGTDKTLETRDPYLIFTADGTVNSRAMEVFGVKSIIKIHFMTFHNFVF